MVYYPDEPPTRLMTVDEAARELGYSEAHLRRLLVKKVIPAGKWRKEWVLLSSDVDEFKNKKPRRGRPRKQKRTYTKRSTYWEHERS